MLKNNIILVFILFLSSSMAFSQSIDATKFCEQFNAIHSTWNKSNFVECQGAVIGTNEQLKTTKYKNNKLITGALRNEVLCYKNAPNLNSVSIIFYENELFDENASAKYKAVYTVLKNCLKSYAMEINGGTTTGLKDDDGDFPDIDFTKAGQANVNLSIEEPILDKTYKVIITIEEPEDE